MFVLIKFYKRSWLRLVNKSSNKKNDKIAIDFYRENSIFFISSWFKHKQKIILENTDNSLEYISTYRACSRNKKA